MRRHTRFTTTEITEAAGFVSPSHFTRMFKARKGPPSSWRKTQGGEAPFRNSDRPLTAPNFCLNNNFSCLNDNLLPKQQNPRPRFSSFVFSVNFVLELFGPKPCFPSSKIPLLYVRPSEAKG